MLRPPFCECGAHHETPPARSVRTTFPPRDTSLILPTRPDTRRETGDRGHTRPTHSRRDVPHVTDVIGRPVSGQRTQQRLATDVRTAQAHRGEPGGASRVERGPVSPPHRPAPRTRESNRLRYRMNDRPGATRPRPLGCGQSAASTPAIRSATSTSDRRSSDATSSRGTHSAQSVLPSTSNVRSPPTMVAR